MLNRMQITLRAHAARKMSEGTCPIVHGGEGGKRSNTAPFILPACLLTMA